jgi:hypothetical protein
MLNGRPGGHSSALARYAVKQRRTASGTSGTSALALPLRTALGFGRTSGVWTFTLSAFYADLRTVWMHLWFCAQRIFALLACSTSDVIAVCYKAFLVMQISIFLHCNPPSLFVSSLSLPVSSNCFSSTTHLPAARVCVPRSGAGAGLRRTPLAAQNLPAGWTAGTNMPYMPNRYRAPAADAVLPPARLMR